MKLGNILAATSMMVLCSSSVLGEEGAIKVNEADIAYFDRIDKSFKAIAQVAGDCSSSEMGLHDCLCEEASALEGLESALGQAVQNKPGWEDQTIVHKGVNYNLLGLRNQVEATRAICAQGE